MASESGDQKLLGNLRKLIDFVSADPNYNPANEKISKPALETLYTSGQAATANKNTKEAPYKVAVNNRQEKFAEAAPRMGSAHRMAKASGAGKAILADLDTSRRKLSGQRKAKAPKNDPNMPGDEAAVTHSTSQRSYDNQVGHVNTFLALLGNIPTYNPNEDELKLTALQAFAAELRATNEAVSTTFVPLGRARADRDDVLYTGDDSVVKIAQLVKAYVSAAFGTKSPLYTQIKSLQFKQSNK